MIINHNLRKKKNNSKYLLILSTYLVLLYLSECSRENKYQSICTDKHTKKTNEKSKRNKSKKNAVGKTYVCSDLHGNYKTYKKIINFLKPQDKLYILGDVIDRGSDGIKILHDIIERSKDGQINFLIGNHEYMMLLACSKSVDVKEMMELWMDDNNGGKPTYEEFSKLSDDEKKSILRFLYKSTAVVNITVNGKKFQLAHADSCSDFSSEQITFASFLNSENDEDIEELEKLVGFDKCTYEKVDEDVTIVVGHRPTETEKIELDGQYVKIDCGVAYGSKAGLLCLDDMSSIYFS